jgi:hypothetical protein
MDFVHFSGMSGELYMVEVIGSGAALFDYDNDGDLDAYLVQGRMLGPGKSIAEALFPPADPSSLGDRLYRNDLRVEPDGTRTLRFTDVTAASRLDSRGYGMGVASGDVDNDGWIDLYLTKFDAPNQLFRNNGDGTFSEVSAASGAGDRSWSVSASFVDFDRDGWLDLYVGRYLRYGLDSPGNCFSPSGSRDYCTPDGFSPLPDRLYWNRRNGTFADVTARSGIAREFGPALGVSTADFNNDGWPDIYVANDGSENQLWINRRDGTFENTALLAGAALPVDGKAEASMGVDAGDFDDDGDEDLVMTELNGEGSNLYVNDGTGVFEDWSARSGVGPSSLALTGFGTGWIDVDNDGRVDLMAVNGTVQIVEALRQAGDPLPLHQRKLLLRNAGRGRFEEVASRAGEALALSEVGRGLAFGDVDNDGDTDALINNNGGHARLLVNQVGSRNRWLGLRLVGRPGGRTGGWRDMLGARVEVVGADGTSRWRRVRTDGSYASASDPRVLVGLGGSSAPVRVRVTWPDGTVGSWSELALDRYTTLRQGEGR